ncbi:MAG: NAD(P)-dependent oxidoreductase [Ketobacteraceae bacterium]|nr:NAD(P)-dependent oxidoreductase [Ketobacteraceae bacterium]
MTDNHAVTEAVRDVGAVIHTAAILPPFSETNPELARKVNVDGTNNIIAAIESVNPTAHLIFSSSVSVHGNQTTCADQPRRIDDPFNPSDQYSRHKVECEGMLLKSSIRWTILRISACVDEKSRMLSLDNIRDSLEIFLSVAPKCRIEYIHPQDVATAMVNSINNEEAVGKRFFLGGGINCRSYWRDLNSIRLETFGLGKPPESCFGNQSFYTDWLDTDEAQRILNFQNHDLEDYRRELMTMFRWPRRLLSFVPSAAKDYSWKWLPLLIRR